jgi:nitroreductase
MHNCNTVGSGGFGKDLNPVRNQIMEGDVSMSSSRISPECSRYLDEVLESRRSIRSFKPEIPSREAVKEVLKAGILAPYAAMAVDRDFRRFAVVSRDSQATPKIAELVRERAAAVHRRLSDEMQRNPELKDKAHRFAKRLEAISKEGIPAIGTAPYYVVVAERRGFPPVGQQSLAHCLENMWLKATSLGLGFQLISITAEMALDKEFCDLLGIPSREFELNGCALGYPAVEPAPVSRPDVDVVTRWI